MCEMSDVKYGPESTSFTSGGNCKNLSALRTWSFTPCIYCPTSAKLHGIYSFLHSTKVKSLWKCRAETQRELTFHLFKSGTELTTGSGCPIPSCLMITASRSLKPPWKSQLSNDWFWPNHSHFRTPFLCSKWILQVFRCSSHFFFTNL